ncbi:MAG TPA: hypothetical protein VIJ07_06745 [Dermatophilaceae bacterium]
MSNLVVRAPRPGWHVTHLEEGRQVADGGYRTEKRIRVVTERLMPDGTMLTVEAWLTSEAEIPALGPLLDAAETFSHPDFRASVSRSKPSNLVKDRYQRRDALMRE